MKRGAHIPLRRRPADVRPLQQRFVRFSLTSRGKLAHDAKPGSPENAGEPRPESRGSLVHIAGRHQGLVRHIGTAADESPKGASIGAGQACVR
jgi:hypothetical protein